jgi:hypothetical protein
MSLAVLSALRSKDPNRQVGAVIVNADNKIVGVCLVLQRCLCFSIVTTQYCRNWV